MPDQKKPGDIRARFDANGVRTEKLSTYFDADKGLLNVKRYELQAILDRLEQVREAREARGWLRRLWRVLNRPIGSKPPVSIPTTGEIARGEVDA